MARGQEAEMKRLLLLAIMAGGVVAPSAHAPAQAGAGLNAAIASIDATIAADFAKDGVGGLSIGVVSGKELIWSKHYGYADAEAKRVANNDTAYRVGSITKQFTALALLQLVEKNQMRLSDPLEKYVPEMKQVKSPSAGAPPTVLQVAMMMSGLAREPECDRPNDGSSAEWQKIVLQCLPQTKYVNEPGTTYVYSNIGYATLGLAIERAGRQPYVDQVRERILVPLGMSRSAMDASATVRANLAHGYQPGEKGGPPSRAAADRGLERRGYRVPNGALFSTVNDLAKFAAWEMGDGPSGILKKETQEANYSRAFFYQDGMFAGYGVGFQVRWWGPVLMLGHGGSTDGYHSYVLVNRPSHLGVIVLRNCDDCPVDAGPVAAAALEKLVTAKGK
jgi:CubicO group peptidase (beta-lactamase class C family)